MDELEWITQPDLGTYLELSIMSPVTLEVDLGLLTGDITFSFVGEHPPGLIIEGNQLKGIISELDDWVPGFQKPAGFTYNTDTTFGGNYAKYGSALAGGYTPYFTIRAQLETAEYVDQAFFMRVENNYSSDRDKYILEQFENHDLFLDGKKVTALQYLYWYKINGYYV